MYAFNMELRVLLYMPCYFARLIILDLLILSLNAGYILKKNIVAGYLALLHLHLKIDSDKLIHLTKLWKNAETRLTR